MAASTEKKVLPSVCPLDCPDTCSLAVTVVDDRIVDVRGSKANPFTAGSICAKVAKSYPDFVHGKNRLRYPLVRTGARGDGKFERISWHAAIERVHSGLATSIDKFGAESVVPFNYSGPHGKLAGGSMDRRFFHKLGASQVDRGALCAGVQDRAFTSLYGDVPGMPPEDAEHSKLVVVWGVNVTVSNLHMQRVIQRARKRGAKLIVVDPKRIKVAEQADLHLPIRPGTDVLLALGVAAELERLGKIDRAFTDQWVQGVEDYLARANEYSLEFIAEKCGIDVDSIRQFASMYAELSPASMMVGVAVERNRNGGNGIRAAAALPALAGKFGIRGGGLMFGISSAFPVNNNRLQRPDLMGDSTRMLNILDIPTHILERDIDPPIGALFIYNHNPVAVHPRQNHMRRALSCEDVFVVGCDVAMTDSLAYADIVLPACSHFEHTDIFTAYGQHYLQRAGAVISPVGEALSNVEIFRRLAARFGFVGEEFTADDATLIDEAFDLDDDRLAGVQPSGMEEGVALPMHSSGRPHVLFENIHPATPSGKIELYSPDLESRFGEGLPRYRDYESKYPLTLITPSSDKRSNATFGGSAQSDGIELLEMHPQDASARGLRDGDEVRAWNDAGEVNLRLKITEAVRVGLVCSAKGTWLRASRLGQTVNALIPGHKTDIADGACYNDARVEISSL